MPVWGRSTASMCVGGSQASCLEGPLGTQTHDACAKGRGINSIDQDGAGPRREAASGAGVTEQLPLSVELAMHRPKPQI
jgi:hypothetical protein